MPLIDVAPKNAAKVLECAKEYKKIQKRRIQALEKEKELKAELLELMHEAELEPVDGKIKYCVDGYVITVTPRDELVQVKLPEAEGGGD